MNSSSGDGIKPGSILVIFLGIAIAASCSKAPSTPTGPTASGATLASNAQDLSQGAQTDSSASAQGELLLTKTCDAINHCTVMTSTSGPIPVGSEVTYLGPLLVARTTSKIVVTTLGGTASGHCSVSYKTGNGTCVLTGGTGTLAGLHANLKVSSDFDSDPDGVFTWAGRYHFTR